MTTVPLVPTDTLTGCEHVLDVRWCHYATIRETYWSVTASCNCPAAVHYATTTYHFTTTP